jgi:hypothetical protein
MARGSVDGWKMEMEGTELRDSLGETWCFSLE